ncbi:probable RNA polymerase sigma factor Y [Lentisphaera araneosa HTCC2155]|jgi:RNA polymerase sigma factor (sigma-70 family)|uniref:Probable RNA polymerase sigma factor Y n=1 Tax=Lentisphaera araneosa HTCC2155 TaxID=313628 RepID=A6DGE9_9BACT|nr:sigma-70 family RNA polymerase sigma factor [Lentisphaera araneosa]EDM29266.1 probable RNA polymerase sigma factor Y [Lentisphaera araneosa HTCC2155]
MAKEYHTRQTLLYKLIDSSDEKSWDEFVRYYEGYIYVVIRSLGVNQHVAEDLLQDVLIKVWKSLPNYEYREGECTFRTWLCLVIRSTVYNFFKKKSTRNDTKNVDYDSTLHALNTITEPEINKIAEIEWKSYISNMAWENVKDEFPKKSRAIFEASIHEESNQSLAEKFDASPGAIRVYKSRVKKVLLREIARLNTELGG